MISRLKCFKLFSTFKFVLLAFQILGPIRSRAAREMVYTFVRFNFKFYVPETHILYFIRRCWFLKCSEEIHYVPIGAGDMWYYVPVDDGWEEVLGHNVYITSQYFSPNAKYWTASSGNQTRALPDRMWKLYHWAMESVHNMGVLVIHYIPVLLSKCQIMHCIVRESNPGPPW